jgi:hypothetical protein
VPHVARLVERSPSSANRTSAPCWNPSGPPARTRTRPRACGDGLGRRAPLGTIGSSTSENRPSDGPPAMMKRAPTTPISPVVVSATRTTGVPRLRFSNVISCLLPSSAVTARTAAAREAQVCDVIAALEARGGDPNNPCSERRDRGASASSVGKLDAMMSEDRFLNRSHDASTPPLRDLRFRPCGVHTRRGSDPFALRGPGGSATLLHNGESRARSREAASLEGGASAGPAERANRTGVPTGSATRPTKIRPSVRSRPPGRDLVERRCAG